MRGIGHDRQHEAQEPVAAQLQHDRGQHDGATGGRFHVGVGQPGVHRPHRHLHGKRREEGTEQQRLRRERQRQLVPSQDVEAATRLVVQVDQRDQHQQRAEQRVQEELEGSVHATRTAPDPDDDVHRDQRGLEEHVEQHAVERREHADHQTRQDQEGAVVLVRTVFNDFPASQHHDDRDEGGQGHEPHRDAIDTQVVEHIEALDPAGFLDELHRSGRRVEVGHQGQGHQETDDRADQGHPAGDAGMLLATSDQQQEPECHWDPDGQREDIGHCLHEPVLALSVA